MKELLYGKSEAVAALNRVEGFNPVELARQIIEEGQEAQLYLDVKYRKLWFRLVYPAGKIISRIINFTDSMAVVEARIYLDKSDEDNNYIANSFSQKFRSQDPKFGDKFLEMAETAAIGRALADAGFGLQFADVGEADDSMQVDAGISFNGGLASETMDMEMPMPGGENQQMAEEPAAGANPPYRQPAAPMNGTMPNTQYPGQQMMNQFYQQAQANGSTIHSQAPQQYSGQVSGMQNGGLKPAAQQVNLDPSQPIEELVKQMSYEQAVSVKIPGKGKFGEKTIGQVAMESPSSLEWFANSYTGHNNLVPAAARIVLERAMQMAS